MRGYIKKITADNRFWAVLYFLVTLLSVVSVYEGIRNAITWSQDFQYDASAALMAGIDPYDMSLDPDEDKLRSVEKLNEFYSYFEGLGTPQKMEANQFPSLLYILTPYALMPYKAARWAWLITNLILTSVIIMLLKKTFMKDVDERLYPVFIMLMLSGTPWRNQLGVGQHTIFALAFFLLAVYLSEKEEKGVLGNPVTVGLVLSLSYLKYTVTAPLAIYFIYRKKWKELLISLLPHLVLTQVAAAVLGESFSDMLIKPLKVASALSAQGSIDVGVLTGGASYTVVITGGIMIFLVILAVMMPAGMDELFISTAILLSLIMTYHRTYDFFIMIMVFGYFATGRMKTAEIIYLITTLMFFFILRVFNENVICLTISGALYYACVIAFVVISCETVLKRAG